MTPISSPREALCEITVTWEPPRGSRNLPQTTHCHEFFEAALVTKILPQSLGPSCRTMCSMTVAFFVSGGA